MNRNKLLSLFISNLSNAVLHKVLEKAIDREEISNFYNKEVKNSFEIARRYREKINPLDKSLSISDIDEIKEKVIRKTNAELNLRKSRGYQNIDFSLVEDILNSLLKELRIV